MEKVEINDIIKISKEAGEIILKIYKEDFEVYQKEDKSREEGHSALTEADLQANKFITESLRKKYPKIPIISEEGKEIPFEERSKWEYFWLVDPLDGTKEFIKRSGEFTVNIALIRNRITILGVVYIPVKDTFYYGSEEGSFKKIGDENPTRLPIRKDRDAYVVVSSRSLSAKGTEQFIEELKKDHPKVELISLGSSLKFCMVAEGEADIYPRFGETSEWDTAAAHAVVKFAGKNVYNFDKDTELKYNKETLLNPWFIVK